MFITEKIFYKISNQNTSNSYIYIILLESWLKLIINQSLNHFSWFTIYLNQNGEKCIVNYIIFFRENLFRIKLHFHIGRSVIFLYNGRNGYINVESKCNATDKSRRNRFRIQWPHYHTKWNLLSPRHQNAIFFRFVYLI